MKSRWKPILMIVLSMPVVYVLSLGPIAFVWRKFDLVQYRTLTSTAEAFYTPLERLKESESLAGTMFGKYLEFWIGSD